MAEIQTREAFIAEYCARSSITRAFYDEHFVALPCECGEAGCQGWASIHNTPEMIEDHQKLYAPRNAS